MSTSTGTSAARPPHAIVLVRHAEKPPAEGLPQGVGQDGIADPQELTVRGWQRAGALVALFDGTRAGPWGAGPAAHLLACRPERAHPSRRAVSTLVPLARRCGLEVDTGFRAGDEAALARHLRGLGGLVVVAWSHQYLPALARHLAADAAAVPPSWPAERFDLLWLLQPLQPLPGPQGPGDGGYRFTPLPQDLLGGDEAAPLTSPG
ncbi:MAG: hypothetical protein U1F53_09630 [Burkholderiaceae bacterium]